jgi:hypothetical protein
MDHVVFEFGIHRKIDHQPAKSKEKQKLNEQLESSSSIIFLQQKNDKEKKKQ